MRAHFHVEAEAELGEAVHFYDQDSESQGEAFEAEAWHVIQTILEYPESGHPSLHGTRRKFLKGFPYSINYVIRPDHIYIYAVAHFSREWGYWLYRMEDE
ncbi:MAG TPA: type II toxin-antitoxin system RelE/ParE family toxin [Longimicrobium sp.]|nr:type II toxin-antitoxin system RelE/ParE family toxin [Longimicrobium sp.]